VADALAIKVNAGLGGDGGALEVGGGHVRSINEGGVRAVRSHVWVWQHRSTGIL
jgi:hypothetical protein